MRNRRARAQARNASVTMTLPSQSSTVVDVLSQTTIREVLEAAEKLRRLIVRTETKRKESVSQFIDTVAHELSAVSIVPDRVLNLYRGWEAEDNHLGEALDMLNELQSMMLERAEFLKSRYRDEVIAVLSEMLQPLMKLGEAVDADKAALNQRIRQLQAEIDALALVKRAVH